MRTFSVDPDRARLWVTDLFDAADHPPATPLLRPGASPGSGRFTVSLQQALAHLDDETRRVHDRARVLAERSHRVLDAAERTDRTLAVRLGELS